LQFIEELKPAMEKAFLRHKCIELIRRPPGQRILPEQWLFSRKGTGQARARFVVGGHRQHLGTDYFEFKNHCAVLASRDNSFRLALAQMIGVSIKLISNRQSFIVFLMMLSCTLILLFCIRVPRTRFLNC
jgi:hypothetical protein